MQKLLVFFFLAAASFSSSAQKVDSIYFNLYTDSLKKGFYNYINVDGKLSNGMWTPLDTTQIKLECNSGFFKGNDLFIDSSFTGEKVKVKAILKANPLLCKETTIYIRKRGFTEALKTNEEILSEMQEKRKKKS